MRWASIAELAEDVRLGKTSSVSLVDKSLKNISEATDYNAILAINEDASNRAKAIDNAVAKGENPGRLAGVPVIVKDNYLTKDLETTAGSNILKGFNPPFSATVVEKLEDEGAVVVAKANLDAFAHGASTENSDYGPTKNPHDKNRVPGGSSGGSAAAVALGLAPFAIGSDTGGSIRQPASYCGVVGYKPTYGVSSRYGVVSMVSSTDVMGPLTRTVKDAQLIMSVIAGRDDKDSTTIDVGNYDFSGINEIAGKTFGLITEWKGEGVDSSVKDVILEAAEKIKANGGQVKEISIPILEEALAAYYIIMPAEVSSNLGRYDGIRYGLSDSNAKNLKETYELSRAQGFNTENKRRIIMGNYVLSSGYYDAYYKKAQLVRSKIIHEVNRALEDVDFLIGAVAPTPAFKLGEHSDDPLKMYMQDVLTVPASLVGMPAISLPAGKSSSLPIGLQVMAKQAKDKDLLSIANKIEGILGYES